MQKCPVKKDVLRIFLSLQLYLKRDSGTSAFLWISWNFCNFTKKETLTQVFFCEFCETSKNNFFTEHHWTTASVPYVPNNQIFPWNKWYNLLPIFDYFAHIFHSPCKISAPCGCVILVLWHCSAVTKTCEQLKVMVFLVAMLICIFLPLISFETFIFAIFVIC